ncbi:MAG: hypothetical protein KAI47_06650, partial [Deltaproteobacteria bacterium]|nr:hypothetical protein [Deltaproteobacteria bacterium]
MMHATSVASTAQGHETRLLETKAVAHPVAQRLTAAAGRLLDGRSGVALRAVLRSDQAPVFHRFSEYLVD